MSGVNGKSVSNLGALEATGGRYADLARYAQAEGVSMQVAQWRWHQLRRGVDVKRERGPVSELPGGGNGRR